MNEHAAALRPLKWIAVALAVIALASAVNGAWSIQQWRDRNAIHDAARDAADAASDDEITFDDLTSDVQAMTYDECIDDDATSQEQCDALPDAPDE